MTEVYVFGSIGMVLLSITIIVFVLIHQKRIYSKQLKINELEIANQRELLQTEIVTTERTQKRIAQNLHDETGSSLTSLRFFIAQLDDDCEQKEIMNQILMETTQHVKQVCNELLPYVLEEFGLVEAIGKMIERLNETTSIEIKFIKVDIQENIKLVENEELAFYRIVQELLNNVIKYAESTYIDLLLILNFEELKLEIIDDGTGIIPSLDGHINSFGLRNIVSRLQYIDAVMVRTAKHQRGTTVVIRKSLNEKENHNWGC